MNPMKQLPNSTSKQFSLDLVDFAKVARMLLVQVIGLLLTFVPTFMGYSYVYHGVDLTPFVTVAIGALAEAGRRYVTDHSNGG